MFIEVEQSPNSETSVFLRFKELGPAQRTATSEELRTLVAGRVVRRRGMDR